MPDPVGFPITLPFLVAKDVGKDEPRPGTGRGAPDQEGEEEDEDAQYAAEFEAGRQHGARDMRADRSYPDMRTMGSDAEREGYWSGWHGQSEFPGYDPPRSNPGQGRE